MHACRCGHAPCRYGTGMAASRPDTSRYGHARIMAQFFFLASMNHHNDMLLSYQHVRYKPDRCRKAIAQCNATLFLPGMSIYGLYELSSLYLSSVAACQDTIFSSTSLIPDPSSLKWLADKATILRWLQERCSSFATCSKSLLCGHVWRGGGGGGEVAGYHQYDLAGMY